MAQEKKPVKVDAALALVVRDYELNARRSIDDLKRRLDLHIRPFFGKFFLHEVIGRDVDKYIDARRLQGASNATINRELAVLSMAYNLAWRQGLVSVRPHIPHLKEDNARQGFVDHDVLESVCEYLEPVVAELVRFCAITGWRWKSEASKLRWDDVDLITRCVVLPREHAKNGEGREFPVTDELFKVFHRRIEAQAHVVREGRRPELVFERDEKPIKSFWRQWKSACRKAEHPTLMPHDLRRSAVRMFERCGIPRSVAMKLSGHKSESVYRRYDIVSKADIDAAMSRLNNA